MVSPKSKINSLIIVFFSIIVFLQPVYAAWWDFKDNPVPPNAVEQKKQIKKIAGSDFNFTYYTSSQNATDIKDFYRNRLTKAGWLERNLQKELSSIPEMAAKKDASVDKFLDNNLIFEKDKKKLIITFVPDGVINDGKTRFTVSEGVLDSEKMANINKMQDYTPKLLTGPKKDIAPVYPESSLINFSEQPNHLISVYFTKDELEPVVMFYKSNMQQKGWNLSNELSPANININDLYNKNPNLENCPTCPKREDLAKSLTEMYFTELTFTNQAGDICKISVSKNILTKDANLAANLNFTTIRVDYEKKR